MIIIITQMYMRSMCERTNIKKERKNKNSCIDHKNREKFIGKNYQLIVTITTKMFFVLSFVQFTIEPIDWWWWRRRRRQSILCSYIINYNLILYIIILTFFFLSFLLFIHSWQVAIMRHIRSCLVVVKQLSECEAYHMIVPHYKW